LSASVDFHEMLPLAGIIGHFLHVICTANLCLVALIATKHLVLLILIVVFLREVSAILTVHLLSDIEFLLFVNNNN